MSPTPSVIALEMKSLRLACIPSPPSWKLPDESILDHVVHNRKYLTKTLG